MTTNKFWYLRWGILCINSNLDLTYKIHEFAAEAPRLKVISSRIFSNLSNDHEKQPCQHKNNQQLSKTKTALPWVWKKVLKKWNNNQNFLVMGKPLITNTKVSRFKLIPTSKTVRITVRNPCRKVQNLGMVFCDQFNASVFHVYQFHRTRLTNPYDGR